MGDRWTSRRGDAQPVRPALAASAARVQATGGRGCLDGSARSRSGAARTSGCAHPSASAVLPTIQGEHPLAFGPSPALRAQGVRSPERSVSVQGGDPATVRLRQPTGGCVPAPCSLDGRARLAWAVQIQAPTAQAGRLAPPDVRRGDDRGWHDRRDHRWHDRQIAATADRNACAGSRHRDDVDGESARQGFASRRAHRARRSAPDPLQVALLARVGRIHVTPGSASALPEVAARSETSNRLTFRPLILGWSVLDRLPPAQPQPVWPTIETALPRHDVTGTTCRQSGARSRRAWHSRRGVAVGPVCGLPFSGTSCCCSSDTTRARRTG